MRLTTKGRFAVTAMIDLALRCAEGPVTLAGIADRQKISLSYLEQLFGKLRRFELVTSVRGPGGGYALAREVSTPERLVFRRGKENCKDEHRCMTHDLWTNLNRRMYEYLHSVTLANLVEQQHAKSGSVAVLHDERPATASRGGAKLPLTA